MPINDCIARGAVSLGDCEGTIGQARPWAKVAARLMWHGKHD